MEILKIHEKRNQNIFFPTLYNFGNSFNCHPIDWGDSDSWFVTLAVVNRT